uniref:Integrase core domain containing protein n=1 Tax=Solanum tuberosum TaxID=4113 RepID=M1DEQ1_SOLTU
MMDQKVQAVNKRMDAFELRVLKRPGPTIDVTTFQDDLASLRADVAALLAPDTKVPESAPAVLEDEMVMTTMFGDTMPPPGFDHTDGILPRSDHTIDIEEARRLRKKERQKF